MEVVTQHPMAAVLDSPPSEGVPFYGPSLLPDINFVTPSPRGPSDFD